MGEQLWRKCGCCDGKGEREQMYCAGCGGGYFHMMGPCDYCDGTGYVYKTTCKPVPESAAIQARKAEQENANA